MKEDVKFYIFENGLQIISDTVYKKDGVVRLQYPFQITNIQTEQGPRSVLIPFLQNTDDTEMDVDIDKIFTSYIPSIDLIQNYKESVEKFRASKSKIISANSNHIRSLNECGGLVQR